jgi:hypothetical protein
MALGALSDLTIFDGLDGVTFGPADPRGIGELNEVETDSIAGPQWDLRAFYFDGINLTYQGGFNPAAGVNAFDPVTNAVINFGIGSIFIDLDGTLPPVGTNGGGNGAGQTEINPGFEYAVTLTGSGSNLLYSIYALTPGTILNSVYYGVNQEVGPFSFTPGANDVAIASGVSVGAGILRTDAYVDGLGGEGFGLDNYIAQFDLSSITGTFGTHTSFFLTQYCGNDGMVGLIPEPGSTSALAGLLVAGAFLRRRK